MKNRMVLFAGVLACVLSFTFPAFAADVLNIEVENGRETVTIAVKNTTPHQVFTIPRPERLVVDVPTLDGHPKISLPPSYNGALIKNVRYGQFNPKTSRFVFDLNQPVRVLGIDIDEQKGGRITFTLMAAEEKALVAETPKLQKKEKKITVKAPKKDEKPLIVIDPGHGGVDPGTSGDDGTKEKDLVLAYAKALKARLLKTGQYRVLLTREDDRFIVLRQRVVIARKAGASMFISLHADSAPVDDASGLSVYTVSEEASDAEAESLAARENKADVLAGVDLTEERNDVAGILISLAERDTKNRSATFADLLVTRMDGMVELVPNAHRFAGFAVLKAPDIPSVLVEIGFLSNPEEEKLLKSKNYRDKVTSGIATGIDAYFRLARKLGTP